MRRFVIPVFSLLLALLAGVSSACNTTANVEVYPSSVSVSIDRDEQNQAQIVAFTFSNTAFEGEVTLLQIMEEMQSEQAFTYKIGNGMVTEICGRANTNSSYWMLYTSDEEFSNSAWGTMEYAGQTLGSAIVGAGSLLVDGEKAYVWSYQTF